MKSKFFIISITIILIIIAVTLFYYPRGNNANIDWINDLSYEEKQVHDMSIALLNPCPSIPIKIVDYEVTGKTTSINADGSYRGDGDSISLKNINVFGEKYSNVKSSLTDWRMYGFFKINGTIGLEYFKNKVVTLDYRNKKIAVSNKSIDYSKLQGVIPANVSPGAK